MDAYARKFKIHRIFWNIIPNSGVPGSSRDIIHAELLSRGARTEEPGTRGRVFGL